MAARPLILEAASGVVADFCNRDGYYRKEVTNKRYRSRAGFAGRVGREAVNERFRLVGRNCSGALRIKKERQE
jgi:hypothetical protein